MRKVIMKFDGSCNDNKNDGDLGLGVHAYYEGDEEGSLFQISEQDGLGSNNEAEYKALIRGLNELIKRSLTDNVEVIGDSEVVIKQMTGEYRCREFFLQKLHIDAKRLVKQFTDITFKNVPREQNELADKLSKTNIKRTYVDYYNYKF